MKDYFGYSNKIVVVTGAASGMGKATAEMLVDLGAKVYALDYNEAKVEGIEAFVRVNLADKESIDAAFACIPEHIDSFFGIAGISGMNTDFLTTCKVDLVSNKYITEEYLAKRMSAGGSIGYITSTAGNGYDQEDNYSCYVDILKQNGWEATCEAIAKTPFAYLPGTLGYPFSKLAMNYYTVLIQKEFASRGIRVNAVLPGSTDTGLKNQFETMAGGENSLLAHCGYAGRLAESREMAEPIVFLNSAMASYISGELTIVDYANSIEERMGFREAAQTISLKGILAMMAQRKKA